MHRTLKADFLNEVANHPDVRPGLGSDGLLDLADVIGNPANVTLIFDHGGFVVHKKDIGIYECHSLFLPEGRGAAVLAAVREAMRYMFTATDCLEVQTRVPENNRAAKALTLATGFRHIFDRSACWQVGADMVDCSYWTYGLDDWMRDDPEIERAGRAFHDDLDAAKQAAGAADPAHPEDVAHNRAVGAVVEMFRAGNPAKAVWCYNRWAGLAGYLPVHLVSQNPVIIDQFDAVIEVKPHGMEVLLCR